MKIFFAFLFFLFLNSSFAQNAKIEEFLVTIYDKSIKVVSPEKNAVNFAVVIENKSLGKILGKIQNVDGKVYHFLSLDPTEFKKVLVPHPNNERLFFIPLAPPFQEVELVVGKKTYEIPPRH